MGAAKLSSPQPALPGSLWGALTQTIIYSTTTPSSLDFITMADSSLLKRKVAVMGSRSVGAPPILSP